MASQDWLADLQFKWHQILLCYVETKSIVNNPVNQLMVIIIYLKSSTWFQRRAQCCVTGLGFCSITGNLLCSQRVWQPESWSRAKAGRVQLVPERVKTLTTFLTSRSPFKMQELAWRSRELQWWRLVTPSAACLTSIHMHCAEQTSGSKTG